MTSKELTALRQRVTRFQIKSMAEAHAELWALLSELDTARAIMGRMQRVMSKDLEETQQARRYLNDEN